MYLGALMRVFISYNADGTVKAIRSHGHKERVKEETASGYYGEATIDLPEDGIGRHELPPREEA